ELVRNQYFNIDKLLISGNFRDEINCNFKVYSLLEGEGFIHCDGKKYPAKAGDTYFIPALLEVILQGELQILKSYL
ncbi:MAG: type I phosphomannose isomerase catalytic subunit, partial [Fusobacteriaceae bacterium]